MFTGNRTGYRIEEIELTGFWDTREIHHLLGSLGLTDNVELEKDPIKPQPPQPHKFCKDIDLWS